MAILLNLKFVNVFILFVVFVNFSSCGPFSDSRIFFEKKDQFVRMQTLLSDNYPAKIINDSSKIYPGSYLKKTLSSNQGLFFNKKSIIRKEEMEVFNQMVKQGILKEINLFDKGCILFLVNRKSSLLLNRHYYIAYVENEAYFERMSYDFVTVDKIEKNWYFLIRQTTMAN